MQPAVPPCLCARRGTCGRCQQHEKAVRNTTAAGEYQAIAIMACPEAEQLPLHACMINAYQ